MTGHPLVRDFDARRNRFAAEKAERRVVLRQAWAELIVETARVVERLIATDGEEVVETMYVRHGARALDAAEFPVQGASARTAAQAFKTALAALLDADLPRRKAVLAPMVAAAAKALTDLITEEQTREADAWRKHTGEEA